MSFEEVFIMAVLAYLAGAVPFGYLAAKRQGINILAVGSGGTGATNVERALGKKWGAIIKVADAAKAALPVIIVRLVWHDIGLATLVGCFAILGHCKSLFIPGFRGGKGVACLLGVALATFPLQALVSYMAWELFKKVSRYVSLSSMLASCTMAGLVAMGPNPLITKVIFVALALYVIARHKENITRLLAGTEPKIKPSVKTIGFTVNSETEDPEYYRSKLGKRFLPFVPYSWLERLISDQAMEWLRQRVHYVGMGKVRGLQDKTGQNVEMRFVATTSTAQEMVLNEVVARNTIIEMILRYTRKKGIRFWGLGGFTSIITDGGKALLPALSLCDAHVTSGNSLTTYNAFETLLRLAEAAGYDMRMETVVVIGGGGSIGKALAAMLARFARRVILVGRPGSDLSNAVAAIGCENVEWHPDLQEALRESRLVVSVASATGDMDIDPEWFSMGSIVVDVSRPRSMGDRLACRRDVLVVAGGIYLLPEGAINTFNFGLHPREVLACMAETMVLAMQGQDSENHSLGKDLDPEFALQVGAWAHELGFRLSRLRGTDDFPVSYARLQEFFSLICLPKDERTRLSMELTHFNE